MASALSKRQQARNERALQDLIKTVAGNDRCADCQARNPGMFTPSALPGCCFENPYLTVGFWYRMGQLEREYFIAVNLPTCLHFLRLLSWTTRSNWHYLQLGIFLCMRCATLHRKLGTHISKVKSMTMDSWTSDQVDVSSAVISHAPFTSFCTTNLKAVDKKKRI